MSADLAVQRNPDDRRTLQHNGCHIFQHRYHRECAPRWVIFFFKYDFHPRQSPHFKFRKIKRTSLSPFDLSQPHGPDSGIISIPEIRDSHRCKLYPILAARFTHTHTHTHALTPKSAVPFNLLKAKEAGRYWWSTLNPSYYKMWIFLPCVFVSSLCF